MENIKIRNIKNKLIKVIVILAFVLLFSIPTYAAGIEGTTIVLNAGHGGTWTGCVNGEYNLIEKDLTLKITNYLKEELSKYYGVNVILTHDGVNFPKNDAGDLAARAMVARNNNADLYVSIHINDEKTHTQTGANVYVTSRTELYKYKEGMTKLGNIILNNLNKLGIKNNGVINNALCNDKEPKYQYYDGSQADYYADIRHAMRGDTLDDRGADFSDGSGISTVLIEHCYMNSSDVQFLDSEEDLKKLAKADASAIIEYLELRLPGTFISNITVNKENCNLLVGQNEKIDVVVGPENVQNKKVVWSSNNEKVATVDKNGNITAVGVGNTEITVISDDNKSVRKNIVVNVQKEEVKFEKEEENIILGKEKTLDIKITPTWIKNKNIVWESDNSDIVEVDNTGKITAKKEGKAIIKATWKDKNLSSKITINVVNITEDTKIEIKNYNVNGRYISKIGEKVKLEDFIKNINISNNLVIEMKNMQEGQEYIGNNTILEIREKNSNIKLEEYICVVYGDINGDGKITPADYVKIKNYIMKVSSLDDMQFKAADIDQNNKITPADYVKVKNHIMKVTKISI